MKKIIFWGLAAAAIISFFWFYKNGETEQKVFKSVKAGDVVLNAEVADTPAVRSKGLSGRGGLGKGEAMLFVFEKEGYYSFWMKDMNFPIDIAWLDEDKKIVHLEMDVSPQTYPKSFSPAAPSLYVLETRAGFLAENNVKIGDFVDF